VLAVTAWGRVFLGYSGREAAGLSAERLGWDRAYGGEVEVNGNPVGIDLLLSDRGVQQSLVRLRSLYGQSGGKAFSFCGETLGWGMAIAGDRLVRLLAVSPGPPSQAVVVRIEQALGDYTRVRSSPPDRAGSAHPWYPGSAVVYTASDPTTGSTVEVSTTKARPEAVSAFYRRALLAEGWNAAPAETVGRAGGEGLALFLKGGSLCCVLVKSSGVEPESVVTVLVKRLQDSGGR
jgi:hypothetical protein